MGPLEMWKYGRTASDIKWSRRVLVLLALSLVVALLSGCATTYRPAGGEGPFAFTLTPEQCANLSKERRTYRATEATSAYVAGGSALLTGLLVGFLDSRTAPAVASGATLAASSVAVFSGSQVNSLDADLAAGQCSR